jgi:hypothetical protein
LASDGETIDAGVEHRLVKGQIAGVLFESPAHWNSPLGRMKTPAVASLPHAGEIGKRGIVPLPRLQ